MYAVSIRSIAAPGADLQSLVDGNAAFDQCIRFGDQRIQRQNDTIANQALDAVAENARRDQMQYSFLAVDDECMTGVVASLEAGDRGRTFRQQVHNLSLAFVTPLGADDNYIFSHAIAALPMALTRALTSNQHQGH